MLGKYMKYLYIFGAVVLVLGGVYISMNLELQSPSQALISYEQVDTPADVGTKLAQKLAPELKSKPFIFFGVTPGQVEDLELVRAFLMETSQQNLAYQMVIAESESPYVDVVQPQVKIDIKSELSRLSSGVQDSLEDGVRVALVGPSVYSSQMLETNPADRLAKQFNLNFISVSITKFPLTAEQSEVFDPPCVGEKGHDHRGTGKLGCAIRQVARRSTRHKPLPNKYSLMVEKFGTQDYLVLMNKN